MLVCVGREVEGLEVYRECEGFAVNMLADSQRTVSETFAADLPDRFAGVRWREGKYGSPILDGCIACLECAPWQRIEAGDHLVLIGRVLAFERSPDRPLVFCQGRYVSLSGERAGIVRDDAQRGSSGAVIRVRPQAAGGARGPESAPTGDDDPEITCADAARLVMGWTAAEVPWAYDGVTPLWHTADGDPVMTVFSWRPDRNDTQNMQVLDRMLELGFGSP